MDAFYIGQIAPFYMQLAQGLTNAIFTERERGFGNEILCELDRIQFETLDKRTEAAKFLTDIGALTLDQVLDIFGFAPIGGKEGARHIQTLNVVNAAIADAYQMTSGEHAADPAGATAASRTCRNRKMNQDTGKTKTGKRALKMPMAKEREYRTLQDFTLVPRESETDAYRVRGTAVVFDTPAYLYEIDGVKYCEVIDRKAFDKCDLSGVIMNYNHGGKVVTRLRNKTLSLHVTECGLELEADLSGTAAGRELYEEIDGGYIDKV